MNLATAKQFELNTELATAKRMVSRYTGKRSDLVAKWNDRLVAVRGEMSRRRREYNAEINCMVNV